MRPRGRNRAYTRRWPSTECGVRSTECERDLRDGLIPATRFALVGERLRFW